MPIRMAMRRDLAVCAAAACFVLLFSGRVVSAKTGNPSSGKLYKIAAETGRGRIVPGVQTAYTLFLPRRTAGLPGPPWPSLVLIHGFGRDRTYHRNTGAYLARRGIAVLTPDMESLFAGEPAQHKNIALVAGCVNWLAQRSADPKDALAGKLDPRRIALAGHSAGGAIALEGAAKCQESSTPAAALCLLDAVPWPRTLACAAELRPIAFCSLRSDPGACNAGGTALALLGHLPFPCQDIHILGASHCDPEDPTDAACTLFCGKGTARSRSLYRQLLHFFIRDALRAPCPDGHRESYASLVQRLAGSKQIEADDISPRSPQLERPAAKGCSRAEPHAVP